jgi:hypothetical protein
VDYTLDNKKSSKEKLKVRRSKIKHTVIMPGDSRRNREGLVKSELEYSDISDSEEEDSSKVLALQEALTFEKEGNKTIHYFSDTEILFKCEGGFYSAGQILALKDTELDWI